MSPSGLAWLMATLITVGTGLLDIWLSARGRARPKWAWTAMIALAAVGVMAGLAARGVAGSGWPGANPAEALALLALGGLAGLVLLELKRPVAHSSKRPEFALSVLAVGLVLAGAIALAGQTASSLAPQAQTWIFGVRSILAGVGLGVWIPAFVGSLLWATRGDAALEAVDPLMQTMRGRAGDPGRGAALLGFPILTAAVLIGGAWSIIVYATLLRAAAGELWLLTAWMLGVAYFHATSGWRPLRLPAWLPVILAAGTVGAGVAAALTAATLLPG